MHRTTTPSTILASLLLLATTACGEHEQTVGARNEAFRWAEVGDHDHGDMTVGALAFLRNGVADDIADANEDVDHGATQLQSRFHVDNCRIQESLANVNELYRQAADAMRAGAAGADVAANRFGTLLHIVQDFYAHTNWIEQSADLAHSGPWLWPEPGPGAPLGEAFLLAEPMPAGIAWSVGPPENPRVPLLDVAGVIASGLMSGTYADNEDTSLCPTDVAIPHGPFLLPANAGEAEYMAKDAPLSHHHEAAAELAALQTRTEICRLERLVLLRAGAQGHEALLNAWVQNRVALRDRCGDPASQVASLWMVAL